MHDGYVSGVADRAPGPVLRLWVERPEGVELGLHGKGVSSVHQPEVAERVQSLAAMACSALWCCSAMRASLVACVSRALQAA